MRARNTTNLRNSGPVALENGSMKANIESYCKLLSLTSVMDNYETVAMDAVKTKISYQEYLYKLLQQQIIDRVDRSINARIKKAGFKYLASLDEFDFSFQPQVDEKLIKESFKTTKKIYDKLLPFGAKYCSMGMSSDFELAIACGSNMIRVGSTLFKD